MYKGIWPFRVWCKIRGYHKWLNRDYVDDMRQCRLCWYQDRNKSSVPGRFYGHTGTFHSSEVIDIVQAESDGTVMEVWFRCQPLPFRTSLRKTPEFKGQPIGSQAPCRIVGVQVIDNP